MIRPFLIAVQFLTRLPVTFALAPSRAEVSRSLPLYPLVGLLLGLLLAALGWLLDGVSAELAAALLLVIWVLLTGGLHIDGLADSVDAWAGGQGNRERMLAIMKDPCVGPVGTATVALVLLLKFAALISLLRGDAFLLLAAAPLAGRTALPLLFLTTPYVRAGGLGAALTADMPRRITVISVMLGYAVLPLLAGMTGLLAALAGLAGFMVLRSFMIRMLGGTTGDTAGAVTELSEMLVLVCVALLLH